MRKIELFLKRYIKERPLFLSLIRAREAVLFQSCLPLEAPILDVGCGDGYFAKVALSNNSQVEKSIIDVGLDVKGSRIEEAKKINVYKKLVTYEGKNMPFKSNYFSTVVSNCVLEHINDLDLVLKEINRVLKPGGLFQTTVMAAPWERNLFMTKIVGNWYKDFMRKKQVHINLLTRKLWDKRFRKAGFQIKRVEGYLSPKACRLIDFCHYTSIPNLISYKLFGKWVLFPKIASTVYPEGWLAKVLEEKVETDTSGAIFYVLEK